VSKDIEMNREQFTERIDYSRERGSDREEIIRGMKMD
jgi:hypothetical protein